MITAHVGVGSVYLAYKPLDEIRSNARGGEARQRDRYRSKAETREQKAVQVREYALCETKTGSLGSRQ